LKVQLSMHCIFTVLNVGWRTRNPRFRQGPQQQCAPAFYKCLPTVDYVHYIEIAICVVISFTVRFAPTAEGKTEVLVVISELVLCQCLPSYSALHWDYTYSVHSKSDGLLSKKRGQVSRSTEFTVTPWSSAAKTSDGRASRSRASWNKGVASCRRLVVWGIEAVGGRSVCRV